MVELLDSPGAAAQWLSSRGARHLLADSRAVRAGDAFVAWPGAARDGRAFVPQALAAGAVGCLVEAQGLSAFAFEGTRVAAVDGLKAAAGPIAAAFHGQPTGRLQVLAVTGTNGKTSCAWWLAQALSAAGLGCGVIGTLGVGIPPDVRSTGLTTPDPIDRKSTRLNSSHNPASRMPSSA
jgi:UDP-N-acetylmuramoyl-L-alanyl-D-glutamate--2,6-diaminopimelate ligase